MDTKYVTALLKAQKPFSRDELRFWSLVAVHGACWEWQASRSNYGEGYGLFSYQRKLYTAHRMAWFFTHGEMLPENVFLLHACDNRACVNPDHLRLGTHAENMREMSDRGRALGRTGRKGGGVVDRAAIRAARADGATVRELADTFMVSTRYITVILNEEMT